MTEEKKKLNMYQIARSVADGVIPEGYDIDWLGQAPREVINDDCGGRIEISRKEVPVPERIKVRGSYDVDVYSYFMENREIDFGKVYLSTWFRLYEMKLFYGKEEGKKLEAWMDKMNEPGYMKKDIVFDIRYRYGDVCKILKNVMIRSMTYQDDRIEADLIYDYIMEE